jgi:hypothetical protein
MKNVRHPAMCGSPIPNFRLPCARISPTRQGGAIALFVELDVHHGSSCNMPIKGIGPSQIRECFGTSAIVVDAFTCSDLS